MALLDLIEKKRDGGELEPHDWHSLLASYQSSSLARYQWAAFSVACAIRGLTPAEREAAKSMARSLSIAANALEIADIGIDTGLFSQHALSSGRPSHGVIRAKIAGEVLDDRAIEAFIRGVTDQSVTDEEIAAFCMAVYLRGMTAQEILCLTQAMLHSGEVLEWPGLSAATVDKHSTGGVGDKVSLPLTGLLVACGAKVPMISGRGLGHTGGTLDKLEAIPGYRINLSPDEIRRQVENIGAVITGQTGTLAPADRRIYAIRDVTGTVSSIPLITASILSKKLAEGLKALVLDVKVGSGAFMPTLPLARALAQSLVSVGRSAGVKVAALLTTMSEPLGVAVGNANEVVESIRCLQGRGPGDLHAVTLELGAELLTISGTAPNRAAALGALEASIRDGRALTAFKDMAMSQGGDGFSLDAPESLLTARIKRTCRASSNGWVHQVDARQMGRALIALGGGRRVQEERVDPAVGIEILRKVGRFVAKGDPILELQANDSARLEEAYELACEAIRVEPALPSPEPMILDRL